MGKFWRGSRKRLSALSDPDAGSIGELLFVVYEATMFVSIPVFVDVPNCGINLILPTNNYQHNRKAGESFLMKILQNFLADRFSILIQTSLDVTTGSVVRIENVTRLRNRNRKLWRTKIKGFVENKGCEAVMINI